MAQQATADDDRPASPLYNDNTNENKSGVPEFLPRLVAVFFAIFDPNVGPKIVHDVPEGFMSRPAFPSSPPLQKQSSTLSSAPLSRVASEQGNIISPNKFASARKEETVFSALTDYLVPKRSLCGHLTTVCLGDRYKLLGYPIWIEEADDGPEDGSTSVLHESAPRGKYERGHFSFNLGFVFDRGAELAAYEPLVRKTGRVLRDLEESESLLSGPAHSARIHSILEQLYEDLNSYSETSILIDGVTSLDLKLFPFYTNPGLIRDWDVPILLVDLVMMRTDGWDLTMQKLAGHINGVDCVKTIATVADVDYALAREAIQHLVYYDAVIVTDLFQFSNEYRLASKEAESLPWAMTDQRAFSALATECENYVSTGFAKVSFITLLKLLVKLQPGLTAGDWIEQNSIHELAIDVRRLISFSTIKGYLIRVHVYPVWLDHPSMQSSHIELPSEREGSNPTNGPAGSHDPDDVPKETLVPSTLKALLDGTHHMDELCVRYRIGNARLRELLRIIGGVTSDDDRDYGRVCLVRL
ncbi:uncharacterized protein L969DRAFT_16034 [Mixia osmundae IAM 14324]|uniref:Nitrogen permease regulator 2 n=1 Tax=Mixia osmundae (strain CBS 9802 / IAM 14324 / JCM 22182 / KY 12970) TaxID=764103 RepID=G7E5S0_MIXOS|nr:uncharacterized protein L969DRAFT_16034 [Mixia osmundae IAM 14324]KEI40670.1 hypothetical protein L969DRAFT_16034 [Mixia osmundae IAM 14324]GAA98180.1 hypothetical protein E5Q_04863 [Mixia osmundae IAM 14324]